MIESLLEKVDILLLGGGMIFTFYKAQGLSVGSSLVEEDKLDLATSLMAKAKEKGVSLLLPTDVVIADKFAPDANSQVFSLSRFIKLSTLQLLFFTNKGVICVFTASYDLSWKHIVDFLEISSLIMFRFYQNELAEDSETQFSQFQHILHFRTEFKNLVCVVDRIFLVRQFP